MVRRVLVLSIALAFGALLGARGAAAGDAPVEPAAASPLRIAFQGRTSGAGEPPDALVSVVYVAERPSAVHGPTTTSLEIHRRPARRALPDDLFFVRTVMTTELALTSAQVVRTDRGEQTATRLEVVGGRLQVDGTSPEVGSGAFSPELPTITGVASLAGIALEFARGRLATPSVQVLSFDPLRIRRAELRLDRPAAGDGRSVSVVEGEQVTAVVGLVRGTGAGSGWIPRFVEDRSRRERVDVDPASVLDPLADRPAAADTPERHLVVLLDAHLRGDAVAFAGLLDAAEIASRMARRISMSAEAAARQVVAQVQRTLPAPAGLIEGGFEATAFASWAAAGASVRSVGDGRVEVDPRLVGVLVLERRGDGLRVTDVVTPEECALDARRPMWSAKMVGVRTVMAALLGDAELLRASLDDGVPSGDPSVPTPRWVKVLQRMRLARELGSVERVAYAHRVLGGMTQENVDDPHELTFLDTITVRVRPLADGTWRVVDASAR